MRLFIAAVGVVVATAPLDVAQSQVPSPPATAPLETPECQRGASPAPGETTGSPPLSVISSRNRMASSAPQPALTPE
jgi:hypothetical protein